MSDKLALFGGPKYIKKQFRRYNSIGTEELEAAKAVIESGVLSRFLGCWDEDFFGGPKVQAFERAWEKYFGIKHAISVNSATSGLIVAIGAVGIEPGDEVIVSPWTMAASATSILVWNAIPVFADIEPETFNLCPKSIERNITERTRAIVVPDIFGHAAELDGIMKLAARHGLKVIEDAAQSIGARYDGRLVGTIADIGVFSLNYHKHIHTGEGGVCVTNSETLCERMQLIRNHAEAVVREKGVTDLSNMIGFNLRLGEIEAAIGLEQLKKLDRLVGSRQRAAERITFGLKDLKSLRTPKTKSGCTHAYYVYPMTLDDDLSVSREKIVAALSAEGVEVSSGYSNIHLLPIFQKKIAYGSRGFPWSGGIYKGDVSYSKGICPVAERMHDALMLGIETCQYSLDDDEVDHVVGAFQKVWRQLEVLR